MHSTIERTAESGARSIADDGEGGRQPQMADAVRALVAIAGRGGSAGLALDMAEAATVLWTRFLKFDAADPRWPDRDRFVLSAARAVPLLCALLSLTGHDGMPPEELGRCRGLPAPLAGQATYGAHPAIEVSTGMPGQGLAMGVGMALAERALAARFGKSLVDHRTWVLASNRDLMEGLSHEAISLAGHLKLERLTVLWGDDGVSRDGALDLACSDDQLKRFGACGWAVKSVDGQDAVQVAAALSMALRSKKPTLIACRTRGAVTRNDGADSEPFELPPELAAPWLAVGSRGASHRRSWLRRLAHHPMRTEFERVMAGRLPETAREALATLRGRLAERRSWMAGRSAGLRVLEALAPALPELIGGSADLTAATQSKAANAATLKAGAYAGRFVHWGAREHGMAAALNGIALHGGLIPCGATYLAFADYLRPALRVAAAMGQRVIHVLTHDGADPGPEGPSLQAIEQLAALRAMPNLHVYRPADAVETAECWELALRRTEGPSVVVLSRQALPALRADGAKNRSAFGGYVLAEAEGPRAATLLASGSEVAIAMAARDALAADGIPVAVVSLPCWELFNVQDTAYRACVLGGVPRLGIEAAAGFGWERWLGGDGLFLGLTSFGACGSSEELYRHSGLTAEAVTTAVKKRLAEGASRGALFEPSQGAVSTAR